MQNWKLKRKCKRKTKDNVKSCANKVLFRYYAQFTPKALYTSWREIKSSVKLTYIEMFSEKHYFRSSETKTKSKSWAQVEVFASLFSRVGSLSLSLSNNFRKTKKNIKNRLEYPIRPCLVVVILAVLKQVREQAAWIFAYSAITD